MERPSPPLVGIIRTGKCITEGHARGSRQSVFEQFHRVSHRRRTGVYRCAILEASPHQECVADRGFLMKGAGSCQSREPVPIAGVMRGGQL